MMVCGCINVAELKRGISHFPFFENQSMTAAQGLFHGILELEQSRLDERGIFLWITEMWRKSHY
jgi:hypothetical protein